MAALLTMANPTGREIQMNCAQADGRSLENVIIRHVETLYSVALGLTRSGAQAEILVRDTARRALSDPHIAEAPYPKAILLKLLRTAFLESANDASSGVLSRATAN